MSRHSGPEFTAPDDQRCQALVAGRPGLVYEWTRRDHRCPKTASQMRGTMQGPVAVCHVHARIRKIVVWGPEHGST